MGASAVIAGKHFERVRQRLLCQLEASSQHGLALALAAARPAADACWRADVGIAATACASGSATLAALQLILMARPQTLELSVALEAPGRLFLDGCVLPVQDEVVVCADADGLHLPRGGGSACVDAATGRWNITAVPDDEAGRVHTLHSAPARYLIESGRAGSSSIFPNPMDTRSGHGRMPETAASIRAIDLAFATLTANSAARQAWFASAIDGVILTHGEAEVGISSPDFPGLIALNTGRNLLDYAETIIAGTCHQKLFQLALVFALTQPGVEEVHYVPSRRSYTTTRRALAAAHEHVNVIAALRDMATAPEAPSGIRGHIERRMLMLETDCVPALDTSAVLTDAGACLWRRLRELAATDAAPVAAMAATECNAF
ncbi:MAG: hypothetical protein ACREPV_00615 [Lysobacter sp.]